MAASITIWNRLEPRDDAVDMEASLSAPIADPLWLLHRQWQLGELEANDAGSPIAVTVQRSEAPLTAYRPGSPGGGGPRSGYDPAALPLEPLIEAERVRGLPGRHGRLAAETGAHWLRLLRLDKVGGAALVKAFRAAFAIELEPSPHPLADPVGAEAAVVLDGRAIDGDRLAAELRAARDPDGRLTKLPVSFPAGSAALLAVAVKWLRWYEELLFEPAATATPTPTPRGWQPRRLEYQFAAGTNPAGSEATFGATAYDDGHLDWADLSTGHRPVGAARRAPTSVDDVVIPVPLSYAGMPAHRHWEIEDSVVSFAAIQAGSTDIVRMLLTEFALIYGDDWFLIPLAATVGSLVTIEKVTVRDTFDMVSEVPATAAPEAPPRARWGMYLHSATAEPPATSLIPGPDSLLIVPALPAVLGGSPLEETAFFRDEQANLVWAVERTTPSALGTPTDRYRYSQPATRVNVDVTDIGDSELIYRLATPIPSNWHPYLPKRTPDGMDITLERLAARTPEGQIVAESRIVEDEEVSRGGLVVERTWQYARWSGGQPLLWLGRRVRGGRGEGSSGLAFDQAEPPPAGS